MPGIAISLLSCDDETVHVDYQRLVRRTNNWGL